MEGDVIHQNAACRTVCGDKKDHACGEGCMRLLHDVPSCPTLLEGIHVRRAMELGGQTMDVVLVNDPDTESLITLLYPLGPKRIQLSMRLSEYGLSRREREILLAVAGGLSRAEICQKLCISKPTLKTHLNNAYRKLPADLRDALRTRVVTNRKSTP